MTSRILRLLAGVDTGVCSTSPAEAAVCFTTLLMELKKPDACAGTALLSGPGDPGAGAEAGPGGGG